ncbi:Non-specific serine/threonine protein kinase [Purpureocillium takamizusanense]|uniref:non-specific serine/threonine protein kinase n=1 Tax=Purpureocillium takamizusanense TaxID=2060973 RepID=A0A9Q8QA94_9HYPO|nr:Non-specific serine/threonine protein kinase [Purpureocillium takamizusanense]UNI15945.1 Non-specific serine/threonine protein kinase [Purpureocillium takamizusanense]
MEDELVIEDEEEAEQEYDWRDDEEPIAKYRPGGFHPVCPGQLYNDRYLARRKLGSGAYSTVWLVQDMQNHEFRAMKVLTADSYAEDDQHIFEVEILKHLRTADPKHKGYSYINHLLDEFEHEGPNGKHVCLIFEPMGMSLQGYADCLAREGLGPVLPAYAIASITKQLLWALSYAHENGVIHTDIKLDNIFVRFSTDMKEEIDKDFLPSTYPLVDFVKPYEPYRVLRSMPMYLYWANNLDEMLDVQICLGDWGVASWKHKHLCERVQPEAMRAPEVFLRSDWDESVDIWSLGPTILRLLNDEPMFITEVAGHEGDPSYSEPFILMQMQLLFGGGHFPASMLDRGNPEYVEMVFNEKGRVKFYDDEEPASFREGRWTQNIPKSFREDVTSWFEFLMKLDPRERPSIRELLDHPWLSTERVKPSMEAATDSADEEGGKVSVSVKAAMGEEQEAKNASNANEGHLGAVKKEGEVMDEDTASSGGQMPENATQGRQRDKEAQASSRPEVAAPSGLEEADQVTKAE